jgi:hypothetical protein
LAHSILLKYSNRPARVETLRASASLREKFFFDSYVDGRRFITRGAGLQQFMELVADAAARAFLQVVGLMNVRKLKLAPRRAHLVLASQK